MIKILNNAVYFFVKTLLFVFLFQTALIPIDPVKNGNHKFIIIGDTQHISFWEAIYWGIGRELNQEKTKKIFEEISKRDPSFILHLGDLSYNGGWKRKWKAFDEDSRPIFEKKIPFYPTFGNHEYLGSDSDMYDNFYKRFPNLKGKKWYSFVYEKIGFIMMNSNFDDLSSIDTSIQRVWYLNQLREMERDDSIKNIIVCSHHPPFTNSMIVSPDKIVSRDYTEPFAKNKKAIIFFSGHCHSYERFVKNGKYFIISGGGGGPRQSLDIDPISRKFEDRFNGPAIRFLHFCEVEIGKDSLSLTVIRLNDNDSFSVAEKIIIPRKK